MMAKFIFEFNFFACFILFVKCNTELLNEEWINDEESHEILHRSRRSLEEQFFEEQNKTYTCDTSILPQPTAEYPVVLFEGINYNNCSANGKHRRLRTQVFEKWSENLSGPNRARKHKWNSMLMLPGANLTFRACCPSGNNYLSTVDNWNNTANLHYSVLTQDDLKGPTGIWYERWLHWVMSFYIRVDDPVDITSLPSTCGDNGACYYGQCGLTGKCECADGYSGVDCGTAPTNDSYPTEKKPLVLFKDVDYTGTYLPVNPDDFKRFAYNQRSAREMEYKSMRVLHNRTMMFARNIIYTQKFTPGDDIPDMAEFMIANPNVADGIWYNYDPHYEVDFHVKVEMSGACFNCSETNGVCYTGSCLCKTGFTGDYCDDPV